MTLRFGLFFITPPLAAILCFGPICFVVLLFECGCLFIVVLYFELRSIQFFSEHDTAVCAWFVTTGLILAVSQEMYENQQNNNKLHSKRLEKKQFVSVPIL